MTNQDQAPTHLKPAIFLHIQKTAGTTIVDLARSAYGVKNVISHGDYFYGMDDFPLTADQFFQAEFRQAKYGKIPFISGHFGYDFAKQFMHDRYSFTFLRNPVERVLSFYYFCITRDPKEFQIYELSQQLSLDEFLKLGFSDPQIKGFIWNCQAAQIAHGFGASSGLHVTDNQLLELAIQHLEKFSYIGFAETFEKDRDHILHKLGIEAPKEKIFSNANHGRPVFQDLPQSTKNLLLELTDLDRILYEEAWSQKNSTLKKVIGKWLKF